MSGHGKQHAAYADTLREFGARIEYFKPLPDQPDGVFVEDAVVLLPEVVVIARPGVPSRLPEVETVAARLAQYRPVQRIRAGQLDGGDVLRIGNNIYIAQSQHTNPDASHQKFQDASAFCPHRGQKGDFVAVSPDEVGPQGAAITRVRVMAAG